MVYNDGPVGSSCDFILRLTRATGGASAPRQVQKCTDDQPDAILQGRKFTPFHQSVVNI